MGRWLLVLLVSAGVSGCDEPGPPAQQPCAVACGPNGVCVVELGREICACTAGFEGPTCSDCAAGFVPDGAACVVDPCLDNPCQVAGQTQCVAQGAAYQCGCDAGFQDNDADGTCAPSCERLHPGAERCDDSSGLAVFTGARSCQTVVRFDSGGSLDQLFIAGEFNGWDNSRNALIPGEDGVLSITLDLAEGDWGYKLYNPADDSWFEDGGNPLYKWVDGTRNSRLRVPDCTRPLIKLLGPPQVEGGVVSFALQYVAGAGGQAASQSVTLDGAEVPVIWDAQTGVAQVQHTGAEGGKRLFHVNGADQSGKTAEPLFVPVWVEETPFDWRDATLYFAMTDRFLDGEPSNNAPVPGLSAQTNWHGGDFAGLQAKIEDGYFDTLGVNVIWISSVVQNTQRGWPGDDNREYSGYHSYWPISTGWTDDYQPPGVTPFEPHFGTHEALQAMVAAAHDRGIRVLVDFVANHVHEDSPWWQNERGQGFFHEPSFGCQESNWAQPIECWFAGYLPDLEYKNVETTNRIADHAWWLVRETGVDGFRLDAVKHMIDDFGYAIRHTMDQRLAQSRDRFYMVGETFTGEDGYDLLAHYVSPDQLDGQFDFPLYWQITDVFLREARDMKVLESTPWDYGPDAIMSTFLGNHDVCRALSQANGDIGDIWCNGGKQQGWDNPPVQPTEALPYEKLRLAWTYLLTTRGVPLIYYGDEIGLAGAGDPDNRRPMTFSGWNAQQQLTFDWVSALSQLRQAHPALRRGQRETLQMNGDGLLWLYRMSLGDDVVLVALNRSGDARTAAIPAGTFVDALSGDPVDGNELQVPAHGSAVLIERLQ